MNEPILKALIQLFVLIANVGKDGVTSSARGIVASYLRNHLKRELVDKYLEYFDRYLKEYYHDFTVQTSENDAIDRKKIADIASQINKQLQQQDKLIVFARLLEFVVEDEQLSKRENEFVTIVANSFNIAQNEFENLRALLTENYQDIPEVKNALIINSDKDFTQKSGNKGFYHIYNPTLHGCIWVLLLRSTGTFLFRYFGNQDLYLNGSLIREKRSYVWRMGSIIKGEQVKPVYYGHILSMFFQSQLPSKITYTGTDIEFKFRNSHNGVHKFDFTEESGQLVGIMGGSGTGKSTLLNVMNGNLKITGGKITINGYDLNDDRDQLEGLIGYVPQDDLLIEELTVFQNLYYNAKLCFQDLTEEQIIELVDKAIWDFDLVEARDLKVGNPMKKYLSGGQRKRLNIALELIREPYVLFCDEPTSGLSSNDSEKVMNLLKRQTIRGKLVVTIIHQPSSDVFKLLDRLLVIDKGGHIIYNGNPLDAINYFKRHSEHLNPEENECPACGNVNSEQVLKIVESRMVNEYGRLTRERKFAPEEWYKNFNDWVSTRPKIEHQEKTELPSNRFKIPKRARQFRIFFVRNFLAKLTNHQYVLLNLLEAPVLAFILAYFSKYIAGTINDPNAYVFFENKNMPAFIFMSVLVSLFLGLTVSAEEIIKDRRIREREKFLNLSWLSYINSKIVFLFALSAFQVLTYVLVADFVLGIKGMTMAYWLVLLSTACFANMVGLNISAAFNSVVTIYIMVPFILVPQILLSGVVINFDDVHNSISSDKYVPAVGDLMVSRWAYEAIAVHQFIHNDQNKHFYPYDQRISQASFRANYIVPTIDAKLDYCRSNYTSDAEKNKVAKELTLVRKEITKLTHQLNIDTLDILQQLHPDKFTTESAELAKAFTKRMATLFHEQVQYTINTKNEVTNLLIAQLGNQGMYRKNMQYTNQRLTETVTNKYSVKKIDEIEDELIQKKDPIYQFPDHNWGRAQFYAPAKKFGGSYIHTLYFNIAIIWLFSFVLYLALLFELFRKMVVYFEVLKIRRENKQR